MSRAAKKHRQSQSASIGLLFGIRAIARFCDLSKNQARGLVMTGDLPAFELRDVLCARKSAILRRIAELEAEFRERTRR